MVADVVVDPASSRKITRKFQKTPMPGTCEMGSKVGESVVIMNDRLL